MQNQIGNYQERGKQTESLFEFHHREHKSNFNDNGQILIHVNQVQVVFSPFPQIGIAYIGTHRE